MGISKLDFVQNEEGSRDIRETLWGRRISKCGPRQVILRKRHDFRLATRGAFSGPPSLLTPRRPRAERARLLHLGM